MSINSTCRMLVISGFVLLSASCRKHSDNANGNGGTPPPPAPGPDVYVLGIEGDTTKYWKNGVPVNLTNISSGVYFNSIFGSGSNLYFSVNVNSKNLATIDTAKYWKNGVFFTLPDTTGSAYTSAIFVSGGDVYVAGVQNGKNVSHYATYWKNGVSVGLPGGGINQGASYPTYYSDYTSSIVVSGNDVYVAGGSHISLQGHDSTYRFAMYWKNGVPVSLVKGMLDFSSDSSTLISYPTTTGIAVSGNDVYVAGQEWNGKIANTEAVYWKNGVVTWLTDRNIFEGSSATSIAVSGNDVFVAGYKDVNGVDYATCWKNGVATLLTNGTGGSGANSIAVSGSDVYVAGYENINGYSVARYWKNGVAANLSDGRSRANANAIYVQ